MSGPMLPFGNKLPSAPFANAAGLPAPAGIPNLPDFQRAQMMEFSQRLRAFGLPYGAVAHPQMHSRLLQVDPLFYLYGRQDPRLGFFHEEPKPSHSYIGLIGMGILSSKDKKLVLSDIYQWILDNYPYFRTRGPGWRNSIRHNLSLNDCFIKSGRAPNGKGHYWAIHPAVVGDFEKGDFRRRRAQRKVRKAMGLAVPDDEDDSGSPPPPCSSDIIEWRERMARSKNDDPSPAAVASSSELSPTKSDLDIEQDNTGQQNTETNKNDEVPVSTTGKFHPQLQTPLRPFPTFPLNGLAPVHWKHLYQNPMIPIPRLGLLPGHFLNHRQSNDKSVSPPPSKKRAFDVESLLAPDAKKANREDTVSVGGGEETWRHKDTAESTHDESIPVGTRLNSDFGEDSDIDVDDDYHHLSE